MSKSIKVEKGAYVSPEAQLSGTITIRSGCIIHPKAIILAQAGPIFFGPNNIIEENTIIINQTPNIKDNQTSSKMQIGHSNHFQVGCQVFAQNIGDCNSFEMKCTVGENTTIRSGCCIGMGVSIDNILVDDNISIYGPNAVQQKVSNAKQAHLGLHNKQLEVLHKILRGTK